MQTSRTATRSAAVRRVTACALAVGCLAACDCSAPPAYYDVIEAPAGGDSEQRGVAGRMLLRVSAAQWSDAQRQARTPFDIRRVEALEVSMDGEQWGTYPVSAGAGDSRVALLRIEPGRELEATDVPPATLGAWAQLLRNGAEAGAHIMRIDAAHVRAPDGELHRHGVAEAYIDFDVEKTGTPMDLGAMEFVLTEEVAS